MGYTQVELTSPEGEVEVWWLPVPEGRAKVGEKITRNSVDSCKDWTITQVCITVPEAAIPSKSRVATQFFREAQVIAYMSI